jgi:hypothetical protein
LCALPPWTLISGGFDGLGNDTLAGIVPCGLGMVDINAQVLATCGGTFTASHGLTIAIDS